MRGALGFLRGRTTYVPRHLAPKPRKRPWLAALAAGATVTTMMVIPGGVASAAPVSIVTYDQCANGSPGTTPSTACNDGWINGDLQKQNSQYAEEQVVPQRLVASVSAGTHEFTIQYEDRKGAAQAHAYDSLATWNYTESSADPCQGISSPCPAAAGATASMLAIPPDNTVVPPCGAGISCITSAHQIQTPPQNFVMFGGTLIGCNNDPTTAPSTGTCNSTAYTHTAPSNPTSDDDTSISIWYTTTSATTTVEFLYGGHLAGSTEPGGWGAGFGSANINGGPYHQTLADADGKAAGNRSNNIQASAILGPSAFTIQKSATPNPANPGQMVTYTITVTNTGGSPGSTSFTDTNDNRVTNISPVTLSDGGMCTESGTPTGQTITCTTGTLNPGISETFKYTANMPTSFTSGSGTGGCQPGQFPVPNTATLANSAGQVTFTECVIAAPSFTINKTADKTTANPGDTVTYTITVTNNGTASGFTSFTDQNDPRVTNVTFTGSSPPGGTCSPPGPVSGTTNLTCTTTTLAPLGGFQTFTITAQMPTSFTGSSGTGGCLPGQFPVIDTVTLTGSGTSSVTVCVNASPAFKITKTASPTSTTPGQPVTYTITVTNTGTASGSTGFIDHNDPNVTSVKFTGSNPSGGMCNFVTNSTTDLSCTTSTIDPNQSQVFTVTANMPATFDGTPGTGGCGTNQFPVIDKVTLTGGGSDSATVCVTATPAFTIQKTASTTTANPGQKVTYTITVTNNGTASGSTSFTDTNDTNVTNVTFVSPTSPPGGSCTLVTGTTNMMCSTSKIKAGASQVFTITVNMPSSFTGTPGANPCQPNQFPVIDTVKLADGGTSTATVCVTATPNLVFNKTATPPQTTPGGTVTYVITVMNNGQAPGSTSFSDTSNPQPQSISPVAVSGGSGNCTEVGTTINCSTGTLNPGQTETFTYTAVMPATFSGNPGADNCGPNQFPVVNTVTPTGTSASTEVGTSAKVCVTATPNLTLTKSAVVTDSNGKPISPPATTGDNIVYTLTYGNTGTADANNTVITDNIPAGTVFVSCSGPCTQSGSPVTTVTWNIGTVPAKTTGLTVTLTVQIVTVTTCSISNTASISSPNFTPPGGQPGGHVLATATTPSTPGPNPAGANASGSAAGAVVNVLGAITTTIPSPPTRTQQGGIGDSAQSMTVANPSVPGVLSAGLISTSNNAKVVGGPGALATDRATAETLSACVLPVAGLCTVSADVVLANAQTTATDTQASMSSAGSTITGVKIQGLPLLNVAPNTCVELPSALFGPGSFVGLYIQSPSAGSSGFPTTCPPAGQTGKAGLTTINGVPAFAADLTVTMIDVHVSNLLSSGRAIDLAVSQATAHSDFPPLAANCGASNIQSVSGDAFIASEDTTPSIIPALVGYVSIPPSGGADSQALAALFLPPSGNPNVSQLTAGASFSDTLGGLTSTTSTSDSYASVASLCLLPTGKTGPPSASTCNIYASLAKSVSYSKATGTGATSTDTDASGPNIFGATQFLNLSIGGNTIALPVTRNMSLLPAGLPIEVILDEQTCDNGTSTNTGICTGPHHSGLTVTAIHVILLGPMNGLPIGAEIKVAQAHSDATFVPPAP
jgi:uncharacterized repeat protein (TIGR01451 family)